MISERPWDGAAIDAIIDRFKALPVLNHRTDDEILGYGEPLLFKGEDFSRTDIKRAV
jgi:hypothetical protein